MRRLPTLALFLLALVASALSASAAPVPVAPGTGTVVGTVTDAETGEALPVASVHIEELGLGTAADIDGRYRIENVPAGRWTLVASYTGFEEGRTTVEVGDGQTTTADLALAPTGALDEVVVTALGVERNERELGYAATETDGSNSSVTSTLSGRIPGLNVTGESGAVGGASRIVLRGVSGLSGVAMGTPGAAMRPPADREGYAAVEEVGFKTALDAPLSTFSIDVDRASYANARRFLSRDVLPPEDAVRVEEFVNAFDYGLAAPMGGWPCGLGPRECPPAHPFAVSTEVTTAPWAPNHLLARISLQGKRIETDDLPPANLVFLLDVSGSMSAPDKLPLVKRALRLLVREMRDQDHVAIVVYAGAAGLVLAPTSGRDRGRILEALDRLEAGGSTAGGAGLRLAYQTARQQFEASATNRVILATDGDFNVGESSDAAMQRLIEEERESGVFLSVLGFGTGNLQDSKMEAIADHGNGNYSYIDSIREAERVLVREFGGTLFAIAKDVKLQVEFNPARVAGYRLIGYENRALANEDFADDQKDAGELGAGHTVTALYEIVPVGVEVPTEGAGGLRYQTAPRLTDAAGSGEWLTVALRYKPATDGGTFADESVRLAVPIDGGGGATGANATEATRWAVAVTEAALLLGRSDYAPGASYDHALALARDARGDDPHGDRAEFVRLVETRPRARRDRAPARRPAGRAGGVIPDR